MTDLSSHKSCLLVFTNENQKIGSLPAVLSARHISPKVKVVVLSDTEKIAGPGSVEEHVSEENDASELSRAWRGTVAGAEVVEDALAREDGKVVVRNAYFEWVPADFVDAYATEEGLWGTRRIRHSSDWIGRKMEVYFGEL